MLIAGGGTAPAQEPSLPDEPDLQCYRIHGGQPPRLDDRFVKDQFGERVVDFDEAERLCVHLLEPFIGTQHQVCYDIDGGQSVNARVRVTDPHFPFAGVDDELTVHRADEVCLPSVKVHEDEPEPGPFDEDSFGNFHLQCYSVSDGEPLDPDDRSLVDQFGAKVVDTDDPQRLCAPAQKDRESPPPSFDVFHYLCYDTDRGLVPNARVAAFNQFFLAGDDMTVAESEEYCVLSQKQVLDD